MYGLTRIVLFNSFIPNRLCQADCEGNTNFSGDNGAGKSSMLQLIPFFWGAEPFNLLRPASGRKTFIDWYLPHSSSMLIFEYHRQDGPCFVMVYRQASREAPAYRFAKGVFDPSLVGASSTDPFRPLSAGEIIHALNSKGYDVTAQIESVAHYRAIIQHDRQLLKEYDNKGNFKQLALRFSVPGPQGQMRHMEKLTQAVLKRSKLFESLKVMIASILKEQSIAIPPQPSHSENERVREDLSCLRGFNQKRAYFKSIINDFYERLSISTRITTISGALQYKERTHKKTQQSVQSQLELCEQELSDLEDAHAHTYRTLSTKKIDAETSRDGARKNLALLEKEHGEWVGRNISAIVAEHGLLEFHKAELKQTENRKSVMLSAVNEIQYRYEALVQQENTKFQSFLTGISEKALTIADRNNSLQSELHEKIQQLHIEKVAEKENVESSYKPDIEKLIRFASSEKTRAQNISETEEQRIEKAAQEQSCEDMATTLFQTQQQLNRIASDCASTEENYREALRNLERSDQKLASLDQRLAHAQSLLEPNKNTLLAVLKASDNDWHASIGKVIAPSLLQRDDLEPLRVNSSKHLYGWSINLDILNVPEHAKTDEQIRDEIRSIDSQIQNERGVRARYEKVASDLLSVWTTQKKDKDGVSRQVSHLQNLLQQKNLQLKQLKTKIDQYRYEQKSLALDAARNAELELQDLNKILESKLSQLTDRYNQLEAHEIEIVRLTLDENALQQTELEEEKSNARKRHEQLLERMEKDFFAACENEGYDKASIEQIEILLNELRGRVKRIEEYLPVIEQYHRWEAVEWSKRSEYSRTIQQQEEIISALIDEIGRAERMQKEKRTLLTARNKAFTSEINRIKEELSDIDITLKRIGRWSPIPNEINDVLADLLSESQTCLNRDIELKNSIQNGMSGARQIIERFPKSELRNAWETLCQKRASIVGLDVSDPKLTEHLPPDLEYLIDNNLPQLQKVTVEKVRAIGYQIENLYAAFIKMKQTISTLGKQLDDAIEYNQIIDNLQDIHIDIRPNIERQEFWNEILVFNQHWTDWQNNHPSDLPGIALETSLSEALAILKASKISNEFDSYFSMSIHLKENGQTRDIYNDSDLNTASSNGLSYLAICILFRGLTRFLCADEDIKIHWPIDELAILSPKNITKLFKMLNDSGIFFFSGFPSTDPYLLDHFTTRKLIDMNVGIKQVNLNMPTRSQRTAQ